MESYRKLNASCHRNQRNRAGVGRRPASAWPVHLLSATGPAWRSRHQSKWQRHTRRNGNLSHPESTLGLQNIHEPGATAPCGSTTQPNRSCCCVDIDQASCDPESRISLIATRTEGKKRGRRIRSSTLTLSSSPQSCDETTRPCRRFARS